MERNKIIYGNRTFLDSEIKNVQCYLAASLLSLTLEYNTLKFEIERNDTTLVKFKQNDSLVYSNNGKQIGTFYVQNVSRIGAHKYRFEAVSKIGILAQRQHAGGIYTGQTVGEVVADIFGDIPYTIKENIKNIKLYGWLPYRKPPSSSARDNLAQVLFAIGATVRTDLDGVPHIEGVFGGVSGYVGKDNIYTGPSVKYGSDISTVAVLEHQYYVGTESKTLFEGTAQDGDIITFDDPMHSISASGFSIIESGANYAKLSSGTGVLTGKLYGHNTRRVSRVLNSDVAENIKTVDNATLVSLVNSAAVLDRMERYYKCGEIIKERIVLDAQRPCDLVSAFHPYDRVVVPACIKSADIRASGILAANIEALVGYDPPDIAQQEYYDTREVLTVSGSFTVPAGVTHIRAVLIGGAYGGATGNPGETGGVGEKFTYTSSISGSRTYWRTLGRGGKGGLGGEGGQAGKVLVVDIDVTPGQVITFNIGTGGAANSAGTETTFGSHSSEDGSVLPDGYVDPVTGDVYATTGDVGLPGGDGNGWAGGDLNRTNALNIAQGAPVGGYGPGENSLETASEPGYYVYYYIMSGGGARNKNGSINGGSISTKLSECKGGKGADATLVPGRPSVPGKGGTGGSGGGGGGGAAAQEMLSSTDATAQGGDGGLGSIGGPGANGAVILYYAKSKIIPSGQLMGKNGRFVLDRTGRLMVV